MSIKRVVPLIALYTCALLSLADSLQNTSRILYQMRKNYDVHMRPNQQGGKPVDVKVSMFIQDLHSLDEAKMELTSSMYFRRLWNDPRLKYTDGPERIVIGPDVARKFIWMPDLFLQNSRETTLHETLKPDFAMDISPDGDIRLSSKMTVTTSCPMDLHNFPMDIQRCAFEIESYFYNAHDLAITWKEHSFAVATSASPPSFVLESTSYKNVHTVLSTGNYSRCRGIMTLRRMSSHYIVMTYIPSFLLVALSCLIFWIPIGALSERTFFGVFLFLAMVVLLAASQYGTPQVGYLKAIDVWCISCLVFQFVAVLETMTLHLLRFGSAVKTNQFELMKEEDAAKGGGGQNGVSLFMHPNIVRRVDLALRIIYPIAFALFNIIYWPVYRT